MVCKEETVLPYLLSSSPTGECEPFRLITLENLSANSSHDNEPEEATELLVLLQASL